jgi:hypothetical protein
VAEPKGIERVVLQSQLQEVGVPAEHSWVWRDLAPNAVDESEINQQFHRERGSNGCPDLPIGIYIESLMVYAMTKPGTKNRQ